jgi:hypothetical protein
VAGITEHRDLRTYINCIQSAKLRLRLVERIASGALKIDHESIDAEFSCLQIRKCLELIAFSSIAAHKETYADAHADFATHWKPKKLLDKLRRLHPDFYPQPVVVERERGKHVKLSRIMNEYLTEDDFAILYDACSDALHEWNPYRPDPRVVNLHRPMAEWVERIRRLLEWHVVHLVGTKDIWIVQFDGSDGLTHAFPAASAP